MANKQEKIVFKSFEQLRCELFPKLIDREKIDQAKQNTKQFGSCLANKAIDQMLESNRH